MIAITWLVAILLLLDGGRAAQVAAWIFFGGKGVMLVASATALCRRKHIAWGLFKARYRFDIQRPVHGLLQAVTRFTWELPQLFLGYIVSQYRTITQRIDRIDTLGGITYASCCHRRQHVYMGMSLGCFVNMWMPCDIPVEFPKYVRKYRDGSIFQHEFGHTIDSQIFGPMYLIIIGLPSLLSMTAEERHLFRHRHEDLFAERRANSNADRYFRHQG